MIGLKLFVVHALVILLTNGCATKPEAKPIELKPNLNIEHRYA